MPDTCFQARIMTERFFALPHLYAVFAKGRDGRSVYPTAPNLIVVLVFFYFFIFFLEDKIV